MSFLIAMTVGPEPVSDNDRAGRVGCRLRGKVRATQRVIGLSGAETS